VRKRLLVTILSVVALVLVGLGVPLGWILGVSAPWAQPVLAFDLVESVGQDAPCARC
jgi:hypothetical protein